MPCVPTGEYQTTRRTDLGTIPPYRTNAQRRDGLAGPAAGTWPGCCCRIAPAGSGAHGSLVVHPAAWHLARLRGRRRWRNAGPGAVPCRCDKAGALAWLADAGLIDPPASTRRPDRPVVAAGPTPSGDVSRAVRRSREQSGTLAPPESGAFALRRPAHESATPTADGAAVILAAAARTGVADLYACLRSDEPCHRRIVR